MSGIGGAGVHGRGVLRGWLYIRHARGRSHRHLGSVRRRAPYDGTAFCSAAHGAPLRTLVLERHEVSHDAPGMVLVLEPDQQIAYAGTVDDAHAPHASPFHGFHGQATSRMATDADRAAQRFDTHGYAYSTATGKQLCAVGHEEPAEPSPDALYASYLFDEDSYTVYEVLSGGSARLQNQLACVIRVPRSGAARDSRETS